MIEYLFNAIRAVAGQEIAVSAAITDDDGNAIKENCRLVLHFNNDEMYVAPGIYLDELEQWTFNVPADATAGRKGRFEYCLQHDGQNLCFKEPIYLL